MPSGKRVCDWPGCQNDAGCFPFLRPSLFQRRSLPTKASTTTSRRSLAVCEEARRSYGNALAFSATKTKRDSLRLDASSAAVA